MFEGLERSLVELKLIFFFFFFFVLRTLNEWLIAFSGHSFSLFLISFIALLLLDFPFLGTPIVYLEVVFF
jgi:hypothetical protein